MSRVCIQGLNIRFGGHEVIRHLDLDVQSGEFLVLLGPSGCGKSTLLHSIAGLNPISGGRILIGDKDMSQAEPSARGVGMVFQSYALYPHMSVHDNLAFPLKMAGLPKPEIEARVARAAAMLQLDALLQRGARPSSPAASASAWPSAAPWCARPACCCWTSRCPTSTPSCAPSCAASSSSCMHAWATP